MPDPLDVAAPVAPVYAPATTTVTPAITQTSTAEPISSVLNPLPLTATSLRSQPDSVVPSKSKKSLIIGLIIGGALALLTGGSALAYNLWYQNTDKVVIDGLLSVFTAKSGVVTGTVTSGSKDYGLTIKIDSKGSTAGGNLVTVVTIDFKTGILTGKKISVSAEGLAVKEGDIYFKLSQLQEAVDAALDAYMSTITETYASYGMVMTAQQITEAKAEAKKAYDPLVKKLDGQWVKISTDDIKKVDEEAGELQKCITDTYNKLQQNPALKQELRTAYLDNKFIKIKESLGNQDGDGSLGYLLDFDSDAAKKFSDAAKKTEFGKLLAKCGDDDSDIFSSLPGSDGTKVTDGRFAIWVDRFSHHLTRVKAEGKLGTVDEAMSSKLDLKFDLNAPVTFNIPKDVITLDELQQEIEQITGGATGEPESATQVSPIQPNT